MRPKATAGPTQAARRGALVVLMLGVGALVIATLASAATPIGLGTADSFAVLAGAGVTNTGPTVINGDLGTCPTPDITGFPPGAVNGTIHAADAVACQAQADLTIAYNNAAGQAPTTTYGGPTDLGGMTLTPGVYTSPTSFAITGTLTLDAQGDPDAVFIFQAGSTLITAPNSRVVLINGAQACNVFWQVGSSATLGVGSTFVGTILALTAITANTNATVAGRLLARNGAVTLDSNTVTRPVCLPPTTTSSSSTSTTSSSTTSSSTTSTTTIPPTTIPPTTIPPTTIPPTTIPPTTIPPTTIPPTTIPPTTIPPTTIPPTTIPPTTIPPTTIPPITITIPPITIPPTTITIPPITIPPTTIPPTTSTSTTTTTTTTLPTTTSTSTTTTRPTTTLPITTLPTITVPNIPLPTMPTTTVPAGAASSSTTTSTTAPPTTSTTGQAATTTDSGRVIEAAGVAAGVAPGAASSAVASDRSLAFTGSPVGWIALAGGVAIALGSLMVLLAGQKAPARRRPRMEVRIRLASRPMRKLDPRDHADSPVRANLGRPYLVRPVPGRGFVHTIRTCGTRTANGRRQGPSRAPPAAVGPATAFSVQATRAGVAPPIPL